MRRELQQGLRGSMGEKNITLGSLFDGIGGFPLAAIHNGITPVWSSEIEQFPIEVTKQRFPSMNHVGDITKIDYTKIPPVDIITGGSPCQDLSVAGKRAGLKAERSGLFMEQIRITKEMRGEDERKGRTAYAIRPRFMVWENVPGAFSSSGGEDFRAVLEETARIANDRVSIPRPETGKWKSAGALLGEQFSIAWRVLDAQYWGVPQRRRRIFLVADFAGLTAPKILFEQDRLRRDFKESQGSREGVAATAKGGIGDSSKNELINTDKESTVLCLNDQGGQFMNVSENVTATLRAHMNHHQPLVMAKLPNTQGVITKGNGECILMPERHTSLTSGGGQAGQGYPCVLTSGRREPTLFENHGKDSRYNGPLEKAPTISASYGTGGNNVPLVRQDYCIAGNIIDREIKNGGNGFGYQENISYTLNTVDRHAVWQTESRWLAPLWRIAPKKCGLATRKRSAEIIVFFKTN